MNEDNEIKCENEPAKVQVPPSDHKINNKSFPTFQVLHGGKDNELLDDEELDDETVDLLQNKERYRAVLSPLEREFLEEELENMKIRPLYKGGGICTEDLQKAVFKCIDFPLTEKMYREIDAAFAECWNKEIGPNGVFYEGFIENYVYRALTGKKILIEYARVAKIVVIMIEIIKMASEIQDD